MDEQKFFDDLKTQLKITEQARREIERLKDLYVSSLGFNVGDRVIWTPFNRPEQEGYIMRTDIGCSEIPEFHCKVYYSVTPPLKSGECPKKCLPGYERGTADKLNLKHSVLYEATS